MKDFEELSEHAYNVVSGSGMEVRTDLTDYYPDNGPGGILKVRGVGKKTFKELTAFLKKHQLDWKQREDKK